MSADPTYGVGLGFGGGGGYAGQRDAGIVYRSGGVYGYRGGWGSQSSASLASTGPVAGYANPTRTITDYCGGAGGSFGGGGVDGWAGASGAGGLVRIWWANSAGDVTYIDNGANYGNAALVNPAASGTWKVSSGINGNSTLTQFTFELTTAQKIRALNIFGFPSLMIQQLRGSAPGSGSVSPGNGYEVSRLIQSYSNGVSNNNSSVGIARGGAHSLAAYFNERWDMSYWDQINKRGITKTLVFWLYSGFTAHIYNITNANEVNPHLTSSDYPNLSISVTKADNDGVVGAEYVFSVPLFLKTLTFTGWPTNAITQFGSFSVSNPSTAASFIGPIVYTCSGERRTSVLRLNGSGNTIGSTPSFATLLNGKEVAIPGLLTPIKSIHFSIRYNNNTSTELNGGFITPASAISASDVNYTYTSHPEVTFVPRKYPSGLLFALSPEDTVGTWLLESAITIKRVVFGGLPQALVNKTSPITKYTLLYGTGSSGSFATSGTIDKIYSDTQYIESEISFSLPTAATNITWITLRYPTSIKNVTTTPTLTSASWNGVTGYYHST
jgi:hypothetical protein